MTSRIFPLLLASMLVVAGRTAAQDVTLRAYVDPVGTILDTRPVSLVVEVKGREVPRVAVPRLPALTNLEVLAGPSTQQSFSSDLVGGRMTQTVSKSLVWTLMPKAAGPAEIPAIEVQIGGVVRMTEPIRLSVATGGAGAPGGQGADRDGADNAPVFLDARLSKTEVWVGEPLTYDVTLYSGLTATNYDPVEGPDLSSFWVEQIEVDPTHESFEKVVEGRRYTGFPVDRRVLVPNAAGEFELEPVRARIGVQARRRDLLDQFFGRGTNVWRRTRPLSLTVKPLPEEGRPEEFSGAVGEFRFEVTLDRDTATVNDAVALKARVSGHGFLKGVPAPVLESTADLKLFDPDMTESSRPDRGGLRASKTWEWLVVPLTPGNLQIPRLTFTFFDPVQGKYRTMRNEPTVLIVERGDAPQDRPIARGDVRLQQREINFIKLARGELREGRARLHQRPWFVSLAVAPLLLCPLVIVLARRRARYAGDHGRLRARRARTRAKKRLRVASRALDQGGAEFHEEIARALVDYLADRFDRSGSGLTYDVAEELLAARDVDTDLRRRVRGCLETCDFARYVPSSEDRTGRQQVLREAEDLIAELERVLS